MTSRDRFYGIRRFFSTAARTSEKKKILQRKETALAKLKCSCSMPDGRLSCVEKGTNARMESDWVPAKKNNNKKRKVKKHTVKSDTH